MYSLMILDFRRVFFTFVFESPLHCSFFVVYDFFLIFEITFSVLHYLLELFGQSHQGRLHVLCSFWELAVILLRQFFLE